MIKLTPSFKEKVWGSTRLEPFFPNSQNKIGEVWFEGVDHLPLLVKFLFTTEKLSVQVHPADAYARIHHNSRGKTEMWHVLAAEPGAQIAAGFRETITPRRLREASLSGEIENLLQWHDAAPGDTFYIPAGTVHAIGAGLTLCEIQQHSDVTYRLHDYGRPRELHLDRAVEVSHLGPHLARQKTTPHDSSELLVSSPYFTTSKWCISNTTKYLPPSETMRHLILLEGSGTLAGRPTKAGDVWYLEAGVGEIIFSGDAVFLQILP
ncbi:MAG: class I mannose-6-phosphate isomerase [Bryobacteraceae bacterium]|jgi:mannose-6-phosphate isomerase